MSAALAPRSGSATAQTVDAWHDQTSFAWIPLSATFAAPYERPISQTKLARILNEWDLRAVGMIYLAERKSRIASEPVSYAILDGRHRVAAAIQQAIDVLPALVYHGLSYQDEALLYVRFATVSRQTALDRFRARIEGEEPRALEIAAIVRDEAGLGIHVQSAAGEPGYFNAVATAELVYEELGAATLRASMRVLHAAWQDQQRAWIGQMVSGMAHFLARYQDVPRYDVARLVTQLSLRTPEQLIARAHVLASTLRSGSDARSTLGQAIREVYNDGLRGANQLPDWQSRVYVKTPQDGVVVFDRSELS